MGIPTVEILSGPTPVFTIDDELYDALFAGVPAEDLDIIGRLIVPVASTFINKVDIVLAALKDGNTALFRFPDPETGAKTMKASIVDLIPLYGEQDSAGNMIYLNTENSPNYAQIKCWIDPETAMVLFNHQLLLGLNTELPDDDQDQDDDRSDW